MSCKSTYVSSTRTVVVVLRSNKVATRESSMTLEEGYEGPGMARYLWRPLRVSVTLFGYMRFSWLSSTTCLPRCFAADTRCQNRAWNLRLPLGCWSENLHTDPFSSPLCILYRCRIFYIFLGTCKQLKFPVGCVLLFAGIMLNTIYIYCRWATMVGYTKRFSSENYW